MDKTVKLKLCISRDIHREFMRNVLGKTHYDSVFSDHCGPSIYASTSRDSFPDYYQSLSHSHSVHSGSNSNSNSINLSMMSIFEFCILCDNSPSPIPGAPSKRKSTILNSNHTKQINEINKKFTFSSPDIYEYSGVGIVPDLMNDIPSRSPLKLDHRLGQMMLASPSRENYPIPNCASYSSQNSPIKLSKELFDGMIRLDPASEEHSPSHTNPSRLTLNLASASTRLDDSSFQGLLTHESGDSSLLGSPTMERSSTLSRSTSIEKLQQLTIRESESSIPTEPFLTTSASPQQPYQLPPSLHLPNQQASPYHSGGFPIVAKRNPRIEKMISEMKLRSNSTSSNSNSPANIILNKIEKLGSMSRSLSESRSHSFHETGNNQIPNNLKSSSSYLEGISNNDNKDIILINPHSKNRSKPPHGLFPVTNQNGNNKRYSKSGSYDLYHPPSLTRVTTEEVIAHRKVLARKMREVSVSKGWGKKCC